MKAEMAKSDYKPSVSLDVDPEDISELSVGQTVTVKVTGKIIALEQREETDYCPTGATLRVEISDTPKIEGENEFSDLADDDDE